MKENGFTLEKAKSRRYLARTITDAIYDDDITLLANTTESLLLCLEKATSGLGLRVNADKTEYMCFNQNQSGDISTLNGGSLKLVNKFTYLESNVSSIENDINTLIATTWTAIDRLLVVWKSDLSDALKKPMYGTRPCCLVQAKTRHTCPDLHLAS